MNPPEKRGIVVKGEHPWETGWVGAGETIIEDGGKYRMWYRCQAEGQDGKLANDRTAYAESSDGIHWTKPVLGLMKWPGDAFSKNCDDTNLVPGHVSLFLDPTAPPDERYRALDIVGFTSKAGGIYIATSPDGIHWKTKPTRVFPFVPDTMNQIFYDSRIHKYVAYVRTWAPLRKVGRIEMNDIFAPWPYDKSQKPFYLWGENNIPVPSNEIPQAISYDQSDPPETDVYTPAVHQYAWADDAYFAFPSMYRHFPDPPKGRYGNDGLLDIQLAVSRDGVTFNRPVRTPYIPLGVSGGPEGGSMYI